MQSLMSLINANNPLPLMLWATAYFLLIYTTSASLVWMLAKWVNRPIETRIARPKQVRTEWLNSIRSIVLFGFGIVIPWWLIQLNIISIDAQPSLIKIILDCIVLILWNDLHFYAVHRLLHTKIPYVNLKQAHVAHHKSVTATPFTAYSMSATEALLLGSVMPTAMLIHDFSLLALILLPIWSISINTVAHSNCDLFPHASERSLLGLIRHHQNHHSRYHGNYSFLFTQLDRWFNSTQTKNNN